MRLEQHDAIEELQIVARLKEAPRSDPIAMMRLHGRNWARMRSDYLSVVCPKVNP
jgi:hypothetical protein